MSYILHWLQKDFLVVRIFYFVEKETKKTLRKIHIIFAENILPSIDLLKLVNLFNNVRLVHSSNIQDRNQHVNLRRTDRIVRNHYVRMTRTR